MCYECIPEDEGPTRGKELTDYCSSDEYCSLATLGCTKKVNITDTCTDNNYMCSTNLCDPNTKTCAQCLTDANCPDGYNCVGDTCVFDKLSDGKNCTMSNQCQSNNCTNVATNSSQRVCQGNLTNGTECFSKF